MTAEDFELDVRSGEVTVLPAGGGPMLPLQVPSGVDPATFRNVLAASYSAFLAHGRIPTTSEVHEFWPRIDENTYALVWVSDEFEQALAHRGVTWDGSAGLSYEQSLTIDKLSNPLDKRSAENKLKELGVSSVKYAAWLKNPLFIRIMRERSENNLHEHLPTIVNKLVGKAEAGDMAAIDRVLAMTGRYDPSNRETILLRSFLQEFLRILQTRVTDKDLRNAIAEDMALAAGNLAMIESTSQGR